MYVLQKEEIFRNLNFKELLLLEYTLYILFGKRCENLK